MIEHFEKLIKAYEQLVKMSHMLGVHHKDKGVLAIHEPRFERLKKKIEKLKQKIICYQVNGDEDV